MIRSVGFASFVALGVAACASAPDGFMGESTSKESSAFVAGGTVVYEGGPIYTQANIVAVLWGPNVDSSIKNGIGGYYQAMLNSSYADTVDEYGTTTTGAIKRASLFSVTTITPQLHTGTALLDSDVRAELRFQVGNHFVPLPSSAIYMVYFPPGTTIQDGTTVSCANFCGYHHQLDVPPDLFVQTTVSVGYAVIPDMGPMSGCDCGKQGDFDDVCANSSHEMLEAITDTGPGSAWIIPSNPSGKQEIGDPSACEDPSVRVKIPIPNGGFGQTYKAQPIWSNQTQSCISVPPATIGIFRPGSSDEWKLRSTNTPGGADFDFLYGGSGDKPVVGDWNGTNEKSIGIYRPSTAEWKLRNSNSGGSPDVTVFTYGGSGDIPIVGDWDGDGTTTIGVYRPPGTPFNSSSNGQWLLRNSNSHGDPDIFVSAFGAAGDTPVVGDWTGVGKTSIGYYHPATAEWHLRLTTASTTELPTFAYGGTGDMPVTGSWNGSGPTTIGVYRPAGGPLNSSGAAQWLLRNTNTAGGFDLFVSYGGVGDVPVVGPWRGQMVQTN